MTPRIIVLPTVLVALGAAPAMAAAETYGTTTLTIGGQKVSLAVYDGFLTGASPMLEHQRSLTVRGRKLTSVRLVLGAQRTTVTALLGGRRTTIFTGPVAAIDEATRKATLPQGTLRWAQAAAGTLGVTGGSSAGKVKASATLPVREPPVLARPSTAVDLTSATITWHVRESFIRYVATGEGTKVSRGAIAGAPTISAETNRPLVYDFSFPLRKGWYDPRSGRAWLSFGGTVTFSYTGHGIAMDANDPEVEINGSKSRMIFRFTGRRDTDAGNRRGVMEDLDLSKAAITTSAGSRTYTQIPGRVPEEAAGSTFAGYYLPGDPFGWVSLSLTPAL